MIYEFICSKCGEVKEIEKKMIDDMPKVYCMTCNIEMRRDYAEEQKSRVTIVPDHMRGINQTKATFNYDQSPSKRRHIFPTS